MRGTQRCALCAEEVQLAGCRCAACDAWHHQPCYERAQCCAACGSGKGAIPFHRTARPNLARGLVAALCAMAAITIWKALPSGHAPPPPEAPLPPAPPVAATPAPSPRGDTQLRVRGPQGATLTLARASGQPIQQLPLPMKEPVPVDPGEYRLRVDADGRWAAERTLNLAPGSKLDVTLWPLPPTRIWSFAWPGVELVAAVDLDGDGQSELVGLEPDAGCTAMDPRSSKKLWSTPVPHPGRWAVLAARDADGDGAADVILRDGSETHVLRGRDGARLAGRVAAPVPPPARACELVRQGGHIRIVDPRSPRFPRLILDDHRVLAEADVDSDGQADLIARTGDTVVAISLDPDAVSGALAMDHEISSIAAFGGTVPMHVVARDSTTVRCADGGGREQWSAGGYRGPWGPDRPLSIADANRDGIPDVLVPTGPDFDALSGGTGARLSLLPAERDACVVATRGGRVSFLAALPAGAPPTLVVGDHDQVTLRDPRLRKDLWSVRASRAGLRVSAGQLGEGPAAVVEMDETGMVTARDAADGHALWSFQAPPEKHEAQSVAALYTPPALGDVDGDRHDDVVVTIAGAVIALDGRTGRTMWRVPLTAPAAGLRLRDVDGDGRMDALVVSGTHRESRLTFFSGAGGRVLLERDLGGAARAPLIIDERLLDADWQHAHRSPLPLTRPSIAVVREGRVLTVHPLDGFALRRAPRPAGNASKDPERSTGAEELRPADRPGAAGLLRLRLERDLHSARGSTFDIALAGGPYRAALLRLHGLPGAGPAAGDEVLVQVAAAGPIPRWVRAASHALPHHGPFDLRAEHAVPFDRIRIGLTRGAARVRLSSLIGLRATSPRGEVVDAVSELVVRNIEGDTVELSGPTATTFRVPARLIELEPPADLLTLATPHSRELLRLRRDGELRLTGDRVRALTLDGWIVAPHPGQAHPLDGPLTAFAGGLGLWMAVDRWRGPEPAPAAVPLGIGDRVALCRADALGRDREHRLEIASATGATATLRSAHGLVTIPLVCLPPAPIPQAGDRFALHRRPRR